MRSFIGTAALALLVVVGVPYAAAQAPVMARTEPEFGVDLGGANQLGGFARLHVGTPLTAAL